MHAADFLTSPRQVLIIEDDDSLRELLSVALRIRGYQVRTAPDGLAGLRLLEAYQPDVVVLDLGLPIASGFDVVNELKAATRVRPTPVIAISGFEDRLQVAKASKDFFDALQKPFEPETLLRAVDRAVRQSQV